METSQKKYFVLRQHYEEFELKNELYNEIKAGRFRQGWGLRNLDLKQNKEDWIKNWMSEAKNEWGDETITPKKAEERYWILLPMLDIKQGDFIVEIGEAILQTDCETG
jgi:hypothetical protein